MTGLERIVEKIAEENKQATDAILEKTTEQANRMLADAREDANAKAARVVDEAKKEADRIVSVAKSQAESITRKRYLQVRNAVVATAPSPSCDDVGVVATLAANQFPAKSLINPASNISLALPAGTANGSICHESVFASASHW